MVLVGAIERFHDLEGTVGGGEHDAPHVHHRIEHGDAESLGDFGVGRYGVNRFLGANDRNPQLGLQNLQQRD